MEKLLRPIHETLRVKGELSYSEGNQAWNVIRLKKDLLKEFPQLKEKRKKFSYKIIMHRSFRELKKEINDLEKEGDAIPIFLFFYGRE
jgi:uncharacterized protein Yka (UPF0111/DUF47 family)